MIKQLLAICCVGALTLPAMAQQQPPQDSDLYYELDPRAFDPAVDVNTDLFVSDWRNVTPRFIHGSLVVHDIFTPLEGAILEPSKPGAVLTLLTTVSRAVITSYMETTADVLKSTQEIYYCVDGEGSIVSDGVVHPIRPGVAVIVPPGVTFSIKNPNKGQIEFYLWVEPIPRDFRPRRDIAWKDCAAEPLSDTPAHWTNYNKVIFTKKDGLAVLSGFSEVYMFPMAIAQMHASRPVGTDVVWVAVEGIIYTQLGKKLYKLDPGMGFKNPSDSRVYHGNINITDQPIKLIWSRTDAMPEELLKKWPLK